MEVEWEVLREAKFWDGFWLATVVHLASGEWMGEIQHQNTSEGLLESKEKGKFATKEEAAKFAMDRWTILETMKSQTNGGPKPV